MSGATDNAMDIVRLLVWLATTDPAELYFNASRLDRSVALATADHTYAWLVRAPAALSLPDRSCRVSWQVSALT